MSEVQNSRKRFRSASNECNFENQTKYFINQHILNLNDSAKMKQIHEKTIQLLFRNANKISNGGEESPIGTKKLEQFCNNVCLLGNGEIKYIAGNKKSVAENSNRKCRFCSKASTIQATDCTNCNLEMCEFCGISCVQCNEPLCMSCVRLFGCCDNSSDLNACCDRCKQIYNL